MGAARLGWDSLFFARSPRGVTFFCLCKRKSPKKTHPGRRAPTVKPWGSVVPELIFGRHILCRPKTSRIHARRPTGLRSGPTAPNGAPEAEKQRAEGIGSLITALCSLLSALCSLLSIFRLPAFACQLSGPMRHGEWFG